MANFSIVRALRRYEVFLFFRSVKSTRISATSLQSETESVKTRADRLTCNEEMRVFAGARTLFSPRVHRESRHDRCRWRHRLEQCQAGESVRKRQPRRYGCLWQHPGFRGNASWIPFNALDCGHASSHGNWPMRV